MDDRELLSAYVDGRDEEAFAQLVRLHGEWVRAAAERQLRDRHLAEDTAQAVFLLLVRRAKGLRGRSQLGGWLFRALGYCVRETRRHRSGEQRREQEVAMMRHEEIRQEADWEEIRPLLDDAVGKLRTADREAVLLRFYQQKPLAEVGKCLGISEDAAQKRVERAVGKLRERLAGKRVEVEAGSLGAMVLAHAVEGMEGGAAGLVEKVMAGIGGGAGNGTAGLIAKGAEKMMVMAKVKVVAVVVICGVVAVAILGAQRVDGVSETPNARLAQTQPSATGVLMQANRALEGRSNVTAQYLSKGTADNKLTRTNWVRETSGVYLFSQGRSRATRRMELVAADGSSRQVSDRLVTWNGKVANSLLEAASVTEAMTDGAIEATPYGDAMEDGGWLLTGQITGVSELRPDVKTESVFSDLLLHADQSQLQVVSEATPEGTTIYHISGRVPWGLYEVWVDPTRDFNITKLIADVKPSSIPDGVRYESQSIELTKIAEKWIPCRARLQSLIRHRSGDIKVSSSTDMSLADIAFTVDNEPDSTFKIDFPRGTVIRDGIRGLTYGKED